MEAAQKDHSGRWPVNQSIPDPHAEKLVNQRDKLGAPTAAENAAILKKFNTVRDGKRS